MIDPFSHEAHCDALLKRRIKFVAEKGAMARLFKAGTTADLQYELFNSLKPIFITSHMTRKDYDAWLLGLIKNDRWSRYSRNGLREDRYAYFAKLLNIIIYEIVSNRELVSELNWTKIRPWLHAPLDSNVFVNLTKIDPSFPACWILKGMTETQYLGMQESIRTLASKYGVPPIWFEDAWTS